jgi:glutathione peroxidase
MINSNTAENNTFFDFSVLKNGEGQSLKSYENHVLLIVNTASKCGFTSQYKELEEIYQQSKTQNFTVLAFPCNQFGFQEPANNDEIQQFCEINYGVTFPVFDKVEVNGDQATDLFKHLKSQEKGILGTELIKWNFTKFLVNRQGEVVKRFAPTVNPKDVELTNAIESLL